MLTLVIMNDISNPEETMSKKWSQNEVLKRIMEQMMFWGDNIWQSLL